MILRRRGALILLTIVAAAVTLVVISNRGGVDCDEVRPTTGQTRAAIFLVDTQRLSSQHLAVDVQICPAPGQTLSNVPVFAEAYNSPDPAIQKKHGNESRVIEQIPGEGDEIRLVIDGLDGDTKPAFVGIGVFEPNPPGSPEWGPVIDFRVVPVDPED
ncbi:hypothetical protein JNJ66_04795 [Candidatus Saccharibacteria bacterium]|nr:hypothetical protein [Candidatus Saccharibacteria bacterium]